MANGNGKSMFKSPMFGAAVGAGASSLGAVAIRSFFDPFKAKTEKSAKTAETMTKWSEAIGLAIGALPGAAMLLLGKGAYKQAGYTCLAAAALSSGIRQIEDLMLGTRIHMTDQALVAMLNAAVKTAAEGGTSGMGLVDIEQATALTGPTVDPTSVLSGADMPQLVGASLAAASRHVQLVGAPALAEHSGAWGATMFSR